MDASNIKSTIHDLDSCNFKNNGLDGFFFLVRLSEFDNSAIPCEKKDCKKIMYSFVEMSWKNQSHVADFRKRRAIKDLKNRDIFTKVKFWY